MDQKRIAFHHFGCKVNFSEASTISREFRVKGYEVTDHKEVADIYVISTCAVTREAEKKCIYAIRQAHRLNPGARIAVIGCFSELSPDEIRKIEGVTMVLGQSEKFRLLEMIEQDLSEPAHSHERSLQDHLSFQPSYSMGDRTRSFLKIQDGCDYFCSYCTIPLARGRSRSDTTDHIIEEARLIAGSGIKEIVLTGVNIGDFGRHNGESFLSLISELEKHVDIPRIRISSIEPDLLNDSIISLVAGSDKFLPHFHIPLQSGCDRILKTMNRKYDTALYASRVQRIRELMPHACIAADVIVGFPGESDEEFRVTQRFLEQLPVSYLHVFSYSKRENTKASRLEGSVAGQIIKQRSDELHRLSDQKKQKFYLENLGRKASVLFESDHEAGYMHGFTGNYIRVRTPFRHELINQVREVGLTNPDGPYQYLVL
jgi:threonylcarbamoyladenosine tRNA methylthiotransferase MtaB